MHIPKGNRAPWQRALQRLKEEFASPLRKDLFAATKELLFGVPSFQAYSKQAVKYRTSATAVMICVYRMRRRFAEILREELSELTRQRKGRQFKRITQSTPWQDI